MLSGAGLLGEVQGLLLLGDEGDEPHPVVMSGFGPLLYWNTGHPPLIATSWYW